MKPIHSPKRRKSSSGSALCYIPDVPNVNHAAHSLLNAELTLSSHSSKRVLSNLHQKPQHSECRPRSKQIHLKGEFDATTSRSRQRLLEEFYSQTETYPMSYHRLQFGKTKYVREPPPPDYMSAMPDEVLLRIFKYLPKASLASLGRTSQRFVSLIEDETLWKRVCVMGRMLNPEHPMIILSRKPLYLRMSRALIPDPENSDSVTNDLSAFISSSQLRYLDLSCATISPSMLSLIMKLSPKLVKLSLEHLVVTEDVIKSMMCFTSTIDALNLTMCYELDVQALITFLSNCQSLKELNMGCVKCDWSKEDITNLIGALPGTLQQLNFSGFRNTLSDCHVESIVNRCPKLVELDLSDSQELQARSLEYIQNLKYIQHLGLSRCYGIEPPAYPMLSGCKNLKHLNLFSLFKETSLRQLSVTLPGIEINKFPFSGIARPTVGNKRSSIWLQRVRD